MFILKIFSRNFLLVLLVWHVNVKAQEVKMYSDKAPSAEEMADILFSNQQPSETSTVKPGGGKMRSISFGKAKSSTPDQPKIAPVSQESSTIGLPIKFAYNSAEVLGESEPFLNEIGRMLSLPNFAEEGLVIEGHTDARGSKTYNQNLSERRAKSVKKYLKDNFNIASNRLFVYGIGENQPLAGVDPNAPENRRVQFRRAP